MMIKPLLIHLPTALPDLPFRPSEWSDITHLDHSGNKVRSEGLWVVDVGFNCGVSGTSIVENLIRVKKTLLVDQVLVVVVVKGGRGLKIQRCQVVVS